MGIGPQDLDVLLRLREQGYIPDRASVIEIGAQQLANSFLEAHQKIELAGRCFRTKSPLSLPTPKRRAIVHGETEHLDAEAPFARDFWLWLGFDYASIDIDGSPGSIPLDLNYDDVPKNAVGKYDLVTNFGTTEHVANQLNAFKVIHDLTHLGGVMVHNLPAQGMANHGLVNYNMKFFWMLARSNGYKFLYLDYLQSPEEYAIPENIVESVLPYNPHIVEETAKLRLSDAGIVVALQKQFEMAFVPPLDVATGSEPSNPALAARYWTVYSPHAFVQPRIDRWFQRIG